MKIQILRPAWIHECWNRSHHFVEGKDSLSEFSKILFRLSLKHNLKALSSCKICITGVSLDERTELGRLITANDGSYSPDLSNTCTHLVCEEELSKHGSVKIEFALKWGIPVVHKRWLVDCIDAGVLLEAGDYLAFPLDLSLKQEENSLLESIEDSDFKNMPEFLRGCHIYLGNSGSVKKNISLKRIVLAAGGARYSYFHSQLTHLIIHNQILPLDLEMNFKEHFGTVDKWPVTVREQWLLDSFVQRRRLETGPYKICLKLEKGENDPIDQKSTGGWKKAVNAPPPLVVDNESNQSFINGNEKYLVQETSNNFDFFDSTPGFASKSNGFLKGEIFFLDSSIPPPQKQKLEQRIVKHSGKITSPDFSNKAWLIFPILCEKRADDDEILTGSNKCKNTLWLEKILEKKTICMEELEWSRPIFCEKIPVESIKDKLVSQSGFTGMMREFLSHVLRLAGAKYTENLTKEHEILVIKEEEGTKYKFAIQNGIKSLKSEQVLKVIRSNRAIFKKIKESGESGLHQSSEKRHTKLCHNNRINGRNGLSILSNCIKLRRGGVKRNNGNVSLSFESSVNSQEGEQSLVENCSKRVKNEARASDQFKMNADKMVDECMLSSVDEIMNGCIFSISQRLWHRRDELRDLVKDLGGIFVWTLDKNCTHYIHQGNLMDETFREFKMAREWGKQIVSPWWLIKCKEEGRLLPCTEYPHTFKLNESKEEEKGDQGKNMETEITESQSKKITSSNAQENTTVPNLELDWDKIMAEKEARYRIVRPGMKIDSIKKILLESKIGDVPEHDALAMTSKGTRKKKYLFVFSGYSASERKKLQGKVESKRDELKECDKYEIECHVEGKVIKWDSRETILVCEAPSLTDKFFSACVSGCWIVRKSFLDEFELENIQNSEMRPVWSDEPKVGQMAAAPKFWREKILREGILPFRGWKVLLAIEQSKIGLYRNVLEAGGAEILEIERGNEDAGQGREEGEKENQNMENSEDENIINNGDTLSNSGAKNENNRKKSIMVINGIESECTHMLYSSSKMISKLPHSIIEKIPEHKRYLSNYLFEYVFSQGIL